MNWCAPMPTLMGAIIQDVGYYPFRSKLFSDWRITSVPAISSSAGARVADVERVRICLGALAQCRRYPGRRCGEPFGSATRCRASLKDGDLCRRQGVAHRVEFSFDVLRYGATMRKPITTSSDLRSLGSAGARCDTYSLR
jgi:hypothetical protein